MQRELSPRLICRWSEPSRSAYTGRPNQRPAVHRLEKPHGPLAMMTGNSWIGFHQSRGDSHRFRGVPQSKAARLTLRPTRCGSDFPAEQPERFYALADELVRLKVDILFTVTRLAALAAQRATKTIPIVFVAVADPVGSKLVNSLARPGGNITGLSNMALELTPKRFELLKEVVGLSKAALLVNATDPAAARYVELSNAAVGPLGVTVEPIEVRTPDDFGKAFSEISKRGLQGVATSQDGLIYNEQPQMFRLALQHRLPLIGYSREMAFNGALMTYGPNNATMFRRAGAFIDKILKGSKKIGDLPVEQPTKYELMINRKTAKAIGLDVSPVILSRADEIIE